MEVAMARRRDPDFSDSLLGLAELGGPDRTEVSARL